MKWLSFNTTHPGPVPTTGTRDSHPPTGVGARSRSEDPEVAPGRVEKRDREAIELDELFHLVGESIEHFFDLEARRDNAGNVVEHLDLFGLARGALEQDGVLWQRFQFERRSS